MNKERTIALVLMDLWAFAYAQDKSERTLREFEAACRLAERLSMPEVKIYRRYMANLISDAGRYGRKPSAQRTVSPPAYI